jgi:hypothetical protein
VGRLDAHCLHLAQQVTCALEANGIKSEVPT